MKGFLGKLKGVWFVLKSKNFILLHSCHEFKKGNKTGFGLAVLRRTNFSDRRDLYLIVGSVKVAFPALGVDITDEIEKAIFDDMGNYKPKSLKK